MTHECKHPDDVKRKPRIINCSFDANKMNSKDIDEKIVELMQSGTINGNLYRLFKTTKCTQSMQENILVNPDLEQ